MLLTFAIATDLVLRLLALLLWLRPLPDLHVRVAAAPLRRHRDVGHPRSRPDRRCRRRLGPPS